MSAAVGDLIFDGAISTTLREVGRSTPPAFDLAAATVAVSNLHLDRDGCRVGVDIVRVSDVAASIDSLGERYLKRLFTEHELCCCCQGPGTVRVAGLAARFAAKEAAIKVLRPATGQPQWRSLEVRRGPGGACDLLLHGRAAELARAAGLHSPAVSLSHEGDLAIAVVIALTGQVLSASDVTRGSVFPAEPDREEP